MGNQMFVKTEWKNGLSAKAIKSKKWSHNLFTKELEQFEVEYKTPLGTEKAYLSSVSCAPMPRREFKTNMEEFNNEVNKEADLAIASKSSGVFSGLTLNSTFYNVLKNLKGLEVKLKSTGRWGALERRLRVRNFITTECNDTYIIGLLTTQIQKDAKEEAHETLKIAEKHYMSSKLETYAERVELTRFMEEGANRLSSFPTWEPNMDTWPYIAEQSVEETYGTFTSRCHNMQTLKLDEQNDQIRWIEIVRELVKTFEEMETDSTAKSNPAFIHLKEKVKNVFKQANRQWHQNKNTIWNEKKGMGERMLNLADDMGRSINQRVDDLQVVLGVKRGLEDNSDFDSSSDEENEPINKKQRVNDEYNKPS